MNQFFFQTFEIQNFNLKNLNSHKPNPPYPISPLAEQTAKKAANTIKNFIFIGFFLNLKKNQFKQEEKLF